MARPVQYTDADVVAAMEEHYIKYGFAKVSAVAEAMGMNRVYLSQRLSKMSKAGTITPEQLDEWRNPAARSQAHGASNIRLNVRLTPENYEWLKNQPNGASETINGLINMCRK